MQKRIAVLGGGSWGTAVAMSLAAKGMAVSLWDIDESHTRAMIRDRENKKFLPGAPFPPSLTVYTEEAEAVEGSEVVIFAVPAQFFRSALETAKPLLNSEMIIVNVAKGIETGSLCRLSEIAASLIPDNRYVVVSGPSHAEEVCKGMPTTLVAASEDRAAAELIQDLFISDVLRVYTNDDVTGVELGGALKNIIALGAGICDGLGYGDNAKAALMTRGLAEIKRLGTAMGADPMTFSGLSGIGDLIVTCTSMHSRNRRCGIMIGQGTETQEAIESVGMVVEGIYTCEAAYEMAKKYGVEMPIVTGIYQILNENKNAGEAVRELMTRKRKHEAEPDFITRNSL
jgi:glycerol-3-phosphate dehydrogenase (NAD(P)+)